MVYIACCSELTQPFAIVLTPYLKKKLGLSSRYSYFHSAESLINWYKKNLVVHAKTIPFARQLNWGALTSIVRNRKENEKESFKNNLNSLKCALKRDEQLWLHNNSSNSNNNSSNNNTKNNASNITHGTSNNNNAPLFFEYAKKSSFKYLLNVVS